jgi:hypothetical protein
MTSGPSQRPISPLRARMIEDMTVRGFNEHTRSGYVRHVRAFAAFIGRSPDTATAEDLRLFQLHQTQIGMQAPSINGAVSALRFFFTVKVVAELETDGGQKAAKDDAGADDQERMPQVLLHRGCSFRGLGSGAGGGCRERISVLSPRKPAGITHAGSSGYRLRTARSRYWGRRGSAMPCRRWQIASARLRNARSVVLFAISGFLPEGARRR